MKKPVKKRKVIKTRMTEAEARFWAASTGTKPATIKKIKIAKRMLEAK